MIRKASALNGIRLVSIAFVLMAMPAIDVHGQPAQIGSDEPTEATAREEPPGEATAACDLLSADPADKQKPAAVKGDAKASVTAVPPCIVAVENDPQNARLNYQAGRALYEAGDHSRAFYYFDRAHTLGSARATIRMADAYMSGSGTAKDQDKAVEIYKLAAIQGDAHAALQIGRYYIEEPSRNLDQAVHWISGVETAESFLLLGDVYRVGYENDAIALKWYLKAAELKEHTAYKRLGDAYYDGMGAPQDRAEAAKWYQLASEQFPEVCRRIAGHYQADGNVGETIKWLDRGASYGDATSAEALARIYRFSKTDEKNFTKAMSWYQKAFELGDDSALISMGQMYQSGEGVEKDIQRAIDYYQQAVEKGEKSHWRVAYAYESLSPRGDGAAFEWHKKGAEAGDSSAMSTVAERYRDGMGVEKNPKEALAWFRKAADAGNAHAMNQLGLLHGSGSGTKLNYVEAGRWYEKAGAAGEQWGNSNLAILFARGMGVKKDTWLAVDLQELAMAESDEVCSTFKTNWNEWPQDFLKALQSRLAHLYAYKGPVDGKFGTGSLAAIDAMCQERVTAVQ
ncbi:hypothetical protein N182_36475 [Sinorhizobium sp. GL2]|nr:hypothetical protein N182_36475 [Sinorhizobium sp. GL2]